MDCVFKKYKDEFKCVNCGVIKRRETRRNCTPQAPSIIKKGINFIKAKCETIYSAKVIAKRKIGRRTHFRARSNTK